MARLRQSESSIVEISIALGRTRSTVYTAHKITGLAPWM
ncbi:MAG: hypothetical protein INF41_02795 [Rhodospirillaceae bacterium]|nr:hypothetical protein [Rhodospirillaceae bacterium]